MRNGEWRLAYPGTDLTFGTPATPVFNLTTPDVGDVDLRVADADRPRSDGRAFGVDYRGGQTITFDLGIRAGSEAEVRALAAALKTAWRADAIRQKPGAVAELHSRYAGNERIVYGRPRRYAPNYAEASVSGLITATADFASVDDLFYDAVEHTRTVSLVPAPSGGLIAPLAAPLSTTFQSDRSIGITVDTEAAAWPVITINGPITNPVFEIVGVARFELSASLAYDEFVVIDTRPWVRSVLRNGVTSMGGGALTRASTRLPDAGIPAGSWEVALRGLDVTGTASARLSWRGAYTSP